MKTFKPTQLIFALIFSLFVTACSDIELPDIDIGGGKPKTVQSVTAASNTSFVLRFSGAMDAEAAELSHYRVEPALELGSASFNEQRTALTFTTSEQKAQLYTLSVSEIKKDDKAILEATELNFRGITKDNGGGDTGGDPDKANYAAFSDTLPGWSEFSPLDSVQNTATGDEATLDTILDGVTYTCTTTPYTLTANPNEIVTLNPDSNILWPGALLQGKGYKDGIGSLRELPVRQRAPLALSIDILTNDNTRTVENPSLSSVQQNVGALIQTAEESGVSTGSDISFTKTSTHSVEQAALELGLSTKFLGTQIKSKLNYDKSVDENTVTAYFVQKMFTVSMDIPQSPGAVFSDKFTQAALDEQIRLGNIGPDNIPTYVANVQYGRVLMFNFTSKASKSEIEATLNVMNKGFDTSLDLSAEQKKILNEAKIQVVTVGGEGKDALAIIRSGDLNAYFQEDAALTSAKPIAYTVRNLGNNSIAKVSETTDYNLTECTVVPIEPEVVGAKVRVVFDHIEVTGKCDSGDSKAEAYGNVQFEGRTLWEKAGKKRKAQQMRRGDRLTFGSAVASKEFNVYYDGRSGGGSANISGYMKDWDPGGDDPIGAWNITVGPNLTATYRYGTKNVAQAPRCSSNLQYTVTKLSDIIE